MKYVPPGQPGGVVAVKQRYDNFIGDKWVPPSAGKYRVNLSPVPPPPELTTLAHRAAAL